ncbi:MAG: heavy metal translocating P-type ATPase [Parcubacteria group bacterium Gr01-1014_30]|nr:MAG: heavy metal translocating P-type ATPase [Parcubacteria group bacterium Gr01-1014_30]
METNSKEVKTFYTCPMHPEVRQDMPGMCPECGMQLVKIRNSTTAHFQWAGSPSPLVRAVAKFEIRNSAHGADKHEGHKAESFLKKFWVSLVLTIPIVAYSELPKLFFGWQAPAFSGSEYLQLIFGSIVFFYGGWVFLAGALRELLAKLPGMMTLIGLATTAAYLWSVYAVFVEQEPLFWELATLITVMLLGHWFEMRAVQGARGALRELAKLLPDEAEVIFEGKTRAVPISELKVGDIVLIKPGAKVPADGKVIEGESDLNESIVTGESKLVPKKFSEEVIAGSINGDGSLKVEVTKIGEDTFLAGVARLVVQAQASKSRLQLLSDKAALYLTIIAVVSGSITLVAWLLSGSEISFAVARLVAVLVIACPHALGLAVPLVASISTNMAASSGFLVKQRLALEAARNVDIVLFDKTGTLTRGEFSVVGDLDSEVLRLAAAVETQSEHPIARAIVQEAREKKVALPEVKNFKRIPGVGAEGLVQGKRVFVGHKGGEILLEVDDKEIGAISVADAVRPESKEAVAALHEQGLKVAMITGDSKEVASQVAKELGIDVYFARVLPQDKSSIVKKLQEGDIEGFENWKLEIGNSSRRLVVAMVGDGVNDAPALMQADIGIAVGAGTNVAIESSGIILVRNDPRDIPKIIRLSKLTFNKMLQNLFWATIYNIAALPLAAGVLYSRGILIEPAFAAVFMSASTVIVAINALLLRRAKL